MASTTFIDGQTPILASWLNDVDALVYSGGSGTVAWGAIIGTLGSQSDLVSALALKANLASPSFTGTVTFAGPVFASGGVGTSGQVLTSGGAGVPPSWTTVSGGGAVSSFNGRTGVVVPATSDYSFSQISGNLATTQLNSGTGASGTTYWRGDGTWATPSGSGDMILASVQTVTGAKTFSSTKLLLGGSTSGAATLNAPAIASTNTYTLPPDAGTLGTLEAQQRSLSANYTTVLADNGKSLYHPSADTTARTWTIDSNANVPYPLGACITFVNDSSAGAISIVITSDTLVLAGAGTTGTRTLAANGIATAIKMTSTRWMINGTGLT